LNTYRIKIKHILPVYLTITWVSVIGLLLFRWIFSIQFSLIDFKEEVWEMWIPLIFPWIPILLFLRQRLKILKFKRDNSNGRFFFQVISWLGMFTTMTVSQNYLSTASGKLEHLSLVSKINTAPVARYYKVDKFKVRQEYGGAHTFFQISGKHNQDLKISTYFVYPLYNEANDNALPLTKTWYGLKFHETISNKSDSENNRRYEALYEKWLAEVESYEFYKLDHFERTPNSEDRDGFYKAVEARTKIPVDESYFILEPIKERYEDRNGNKFTWIFGSFGIALAVFLFSLSFPGYMANEHKRFLQGKKAKPDDFIDAINFLIPRGKHATTSVILDLNILMFLLMLFSGIHIISPQAQDLLSWGGNRRLETMNGDWWRLVTSMFIHSGVMHLALNIGGLVIAAIFIEPLLKWKNYIILYVVSGICGSLCSIWWHTNSVSIGASGAIFGLYGAFIGIFLTASEKEKIGSEIIKFVLIFVGINLIWGLAGGVDNAAHLGGLISGAAIGALLFRFNKPQKQSVRG
jgi:rhomboid protease GluP